MYTEYFGFTEKPFSLVPDPNYLFLSSRHEKALTFLEYGLSEKVGFIMLTGEIGIGKTTLIRHLLNQVEADTELAVVFNTNVDAVTLLRQILGEFEIDHGPTRDKAELLELLYAFLIDQFAGNRKVFLIIDEAQNLSSDALEEVRMLSNLQTDKEMLLQVIIVGQPDLRDKIKSPELRQFAQRISASFHMSALTREETSAYVRHRLETAGGRVSLFDPALFDHIYEASGGIPRTINLVCDALLVYAYADRAEVVTPELLDQVVRDNGGMGMFLARGEDPPSWAEGTESGAGIEGRLAGLEARVSVLDAALEGRLAETESRAEYCRDELANRLWRLYMAEKRHNRRLAYELGRLKEKYARLVQDSGAEEEPILLKDIVK